MKGGLRQIRIKKAARRWNADTLLIIEMAKHSKDGCFKWAQLVWQEIDMYIMLGKQVGRNEIESLCARRGFDGMMREYLVGMLVTVGLGKALKSKEEGGGE